jgi:ribosomal protein L29
MLNKSDIEAYAKELEAQQKAAEKAVEQAKANLNAVVGARQAVAHLLTVCEENSKNEEVTSVEND